MTIIFFRVHFHASLPSPPSSLPFPCVFNKGLKRRTLNTTLRCVCATLWWNTSRLAQCYLIETAQMQMILRSLSSTRSSSFARDQTSSCKCSRSTCVRIRCSWDKDEERCTLAFSRLANNRGQGSGFHAAVLPLEEAVIRAESEGTAAHGAQETTMTCNSIQNWRNCEQHSSTSRLTTVGL